jgi:hypothetical protein
LNDKSREVLLKRMIAQSASGGEQMDGMHYVGLDVHKKTISFCIREADGRIVDEGMILANSPWCNRPDFGTTVGVV